MSCVFQNINPPTPLSARRMCVLPPPTKALYGENLCQRRYGMNGRFQLILSTEINANWFFWDSHWLEIWKNRFCDGPNRGSVAMDSEPKFVNLLMRPEIHSQPGGPVRKLFLTYRPARLHWFFDVYKLGLRRDLPARDGGHEQLISNIGRMKPAFAERDKKHDRSPRNLDNLVLKPVMSLH